MIGIAASSASMTEGLTHPLRNEPGLKHALAAQHALHEGPGGLSMRELERGDAGDDERDA
jgi:hypothetical protein